MALDAQFNAPGSMAAILERLDQPPLPVRTIRSQPDVTVDFGTSAAIQSTNVFLLRRTEPLADGSTAAIEPIDGDLIVTETGSFMLTSEILLDTEGLTWTCGAEPYRG